jgi:hypothetical protein
MLLCAQKLGQSTSWNTLWETSDDTEARVASFERPPTDANHCSFDTLNTFTDSESLCSLTNPLKCYLPNTYAA